MRHSPRLFIFAFQIAQDCRGNGCPVRRSACAQLQYAQQQAAPTQLQQQQQGSCNRTTTTGDRQGSNVVRAATTTWQQQQRRQQQRGPHRTARPRIRAAIQLGNRTKSSSIPVSTVRVIQSLFSRRLSCLHRTAHTVHTRGQTVQSRTQALCL